ncbi:diaminopimelate epimerase [Nocardia yamanashiensis]|uniref:diaminopimelate epimerase n=1 Tax=Nocardia yamanashiensis TaxID=209247 RepID=UPI000830FEF5|nr:diaminopimelate epimerase [Nocardia yamanashiensis]
MPAHRDEWEQRLLADRKMLEVFATAIGGPFHVMYPARVVRNIRAFQAVFQRTGVPGTIYYGKKANKAACVVAACVQAGAGVDVSSLGELEAALAGGVRGADLVVTGPAKSEELLGAAVRHDALVAVDAPDELDRLAGTGARVLLRVLPPHSDSRFGLTAGEVEQALATLDRDAIRLEGFSFHLGGYEAAPRAELALRLIEYCREARYLGHPADTISIGGGFGVDYVPAEHWRSFLRGLNPLWFHRDRAPKPESFYPYHCPAPGPAMLETILAHRQLGARLRTADIRLAIEPGRALVDRAGSTVFAVQGVKTRTAHGHPYSILTVNGSSLSLSEQWFDTEYLPDPALWPPRPGRVTPACVGGASCLEDDMISWRRIPFPRAARPGDLLIYPNTAGYQMDSNESTFHELPIPPKVVLRDAEGAKFDWTLDGTTALR